MSRSRIFFIFISTIFFSFFLLIYVVPLIDFSVANPSWNGYSHVSSLLDASIINEPLTSLSKYPPQFSFLIIIPYEKYLDKELSTISKFVSEGGTLLLMSDYGFGNDILEYLDAPIRIDVSGMLIDPLFKYEKSTFPKIYSFGDDVSSWNISSIVLNHATILSILDARAKVLGESSSFSYYDTNFNSQYDSDEPVGPFPVFASFKYGEGVVYVLSDPSIVLNSMLDISDNRGFIESLVGNRQVVIDQFHLRKNIHYVIREALISGIIFIQQIYIFPYIIVILIISISYYFRKFLK